MNRQEAAHLLLAGDPRGRLRAARWFARHSEAKDLLTLRQALELGTDHWTRHALLAALASLGEPDGGQSPGLTGEGDTPDGFSQEVYSEAVEETAGQLVHELEPVLGTLKILAQRELPHYETTGTYGQILRLERLLAAIDRLRKAAAPPKTTEFELADVVRKIAEEAVQGDVSKVSLAGPRPFMVFADQSLVELILVNGIRNAVESTALVADAQGPVITWGDTDKSYWLSILDEGVGIPAGRSSSVFEIGVTSKKDHLGMGLTLARQAATSLHGTLNLEPRDSKGAAYRFTWPKATVR